MKFSRVFPFVIIDPKLKVTRIVPNMFIAFFIAFITSRGGQYRKHMRIYTQLSLIAMTEVVLEK